MRIRVLITLAISLFLLQSFAGSHARTHAAAPAGYHVIDKVKLGGDGGWDCLIVDSKARRIYISRSTHVMVVDMDTEKVVGDIPKTNGVHDIAVVPDLGKGFISNDPASKTVFTCNGASKDVSAIDPKTETVRGTIPLDARPEFAVSDDNGHLYINLEDKSAIAAIDSRKMTVEARWPLAPGEEPTGLAIDRKHHRLFAACANKLMAVVNADNGHLITTLPTGSGADGAEFDASSQTAFNPNGGDGTLTVIHEDSPDKFSVVENVPTQRGARTMTLDPKSHKLFLITAEFGPPPAPTAERPRPRPSIIPGSFTLLVVGK